MSSFLGDAINFEIFISAEGVLSDSLKILWAVTGSVGDMIIWETEGIIEGDSIAEKSWIGLLRGMSDYCEKSSIIQLGKHGLSIWLNETGEISSLSSTLLLIYSRVGIWTNSEGAKEGVEAIGLTD